MCMAGEYRWDVQFTEADEVEVAVVQFLVL